MNDLASILTKIGAPLLSTAIGGPVGALASAAIGALAEALGTPATPEAVAKEIENNPQAATAVRKIEAEQAPDMMKAYLADVQDARATNVKLIESGSITGNAPAILTALNFIGFYSILCLILWKGLPDTGARELVSGMVGAVIGSYLASNNYFFGTSASSARSGEALRSIAQQASVPTAGQVAGKVIDAAAKTVAKR